mmetsp:Transcript_14783/g.27046  ORF Transcript_14783/g.27046 Transcript_14783/m.27046 type:complete len:201 (-) Transcript_14783:118-720(-)
MGADQSSIQQSNGEVKMKVKEDLMLPTSGVVVKRITNRHEFEQELLRNETLGDMTSSKIFAKWAHDAFKHRDAVLAAMDSEEGSTRSGGTWDRQTSGENIGSKYCIEVEIFKLKDRTLYQGQWMHGLMHGTGIMFSPDAKRYSGNFRYGKKEGAGTLTWKDGRVYKGQFANNKCHGNGQITGSFGEKYKCKAISGKIQTI